MLVERPYTLIDATTFADQIVKFSGSPLLGRTRQSGSSGNKAPEETIFSTTLPSLENTDRNAPKPVLFFPRLPVEVPRASTEQAWEGVVCEVKSGHKCFFARLTDLTGSEPEEMVEIPFEEISKDDFDLLQEGAFFYWYIYYRESTSGQVMRTSMIRFRRLPVWTRKEIEEAKKEAAQLMKLLDDDDGGSKTP